MVSLEGIVPLFIRVRDLCVCSRFGISENLATDVLVETSFVEGCIPGIFPTERIVVPWHSKQVAIISTMPAIISKNADDTVFDVNTHLQDDVSSKEFNLCYVMRQVTIPAHSQAAVLVSC